MPEPHLRSLRRVSACIMNRSGVQQKLKAIECRIVWPRRRIYMNDTIQFAMEPYDGGNFDIRIVDFDWLDLSEEEIDQRRNEAHRDSTRYLIRIRAETVAGRKTACWLYTRLPIYSDYHIKHQVEVATDQEYSQDVALSALIDEGREMLELPQDAGGHFDSRCEGWLASCEYELAIRFGPSKRASFCAEGMQANDQRERIRDKLEFLRRLV